MQNIKYLSSKYPYPSSHANEHVRPFSEQSVPSAANDARPEASVQPVPFAVNHSILFFFAIQAAMYAAMAMMTADAAPMAHPPASILTRSHLLNSRSTG